MKKKIFSRYFSSAFYAALLSVALPLSAEEASGVEIRLSEVELQEIFKNPTRSYVYVGKEASSIVEVMEELSKLEDNPNSLIHGLVDHARKGFNIGNYDAVAQALEEAELLLLKHSDALGEEKTAELTNTLDTIIEQVIEEKLNLDAELLSFLKDSVVQDESRSCCKPKPHCHGLRLLVVKEKVDFLGKVKFKNDVTFKDDVKFKDDVTFEDEATFEDPATFEDNVVIEGTLSVTDLVVLSCMDSLCVNTLSITDLVTVSCIDNLCVNTLSVTDLAVASCIDNLCVSTLSVTDLVIIGGSCLDDLCVNSLSVTDLVVGSCIDNLCVNTLSITDLAVASCVDNLCVSTLSVTDEVVTNLTVVNCIPNLCVTNLSITNEIVTGTLQLTALTPAGVVHNSATGVLSTSLIINADVAPGAGIVDTKLATISTAGKVANSATTATSANTPNTIVLRDGAGNFSAGTITANLNGNATTATTATNATISVSFSGALVGDVTGTQGATVVASVGGQTAVNVAAATVLANNATNLNVANTIVRRDGTGSFAAQIVSVVDSVLSRNLVLSTNPSTATNGNILKGANSFIHNFGTNNTFLGINAGNFTMTGAGNTGIGVNSLLANTAGAQNTAVGQTSLQSNTTGSSNTALGFRAMETNTIGAANTAVGQNALLSNTTGNNNVGVGAHALQVNITALNNVAVGFNALAASNADQNTAVGCNTLENLTTGTSNTALGRFAGQNASGASSNNIYINNLGAVENDTTRIGGTQTSCFIAGIRGATTGVADAIAVLIDSAGQLGTISSSAQYKHDIQDMNDASSNILELRPVTFVYNADESNTTQYGLIAEEVDKVFPSLVVYNQEGNPETLKYHVLPVLLLNEMKKQQLSINDLKSLVASCLDRLSALENNA